MAEQGFSAKQILEFYYPGATFGWLEERAPGAPITPELRDSPSR